MQKRENNFCNKCSMITIVAQPNKVSNKINTQQVTHHAMYYLMPHEHPWALTTWHV